MKDNLGNQFKQLPMFMSANEIKADYQPLPGDKKMKRKPGSSGWGSESYTYEQDDALYARKANEAKHRGKGIRSGGPSLHQSIEQQGVQTPVHLGTETPNKKYWFDSMSSDKPPVLGGHHRVAVMGEVAPDKLIPVMHHKDIMGARGLDPTQGDWQKAYGKKYS